MLTFSPTPESSWNTFTKGKAQYKYTCSSWYAYFCLRLRDFYISNSNKSYLRAHKGRKEARGVSWDISNTFKDCFAINCTWTGAQPGANLCQWSRRDLVLPGDLWGLDSSTNWSYWRSLRPLLLLSFTSCRGLQDWDVDSNPASATRVTVVLQWKRDKTSWMLRHMKK